MFLSPCLTTRSPLSLTTPLGKHHRNFSQASSFMPLTLPTRLVTLSSVLTSTLFALAFTVFLGTCAQTRSITTPLTTTTERHNHVSHRTNCTSHLSSAY